MQRHLTDTPRSHDSTIRLREFLRLARTGAANPANSALVRQGRAPRVARLREFLRIDRGRLA